MDVWDFDAGECDWLLVLAESRLQWVTSTPTLITITPHFSIIPPLSKSVNDTLALVPIQLIKLYVHRVLDVSPAMRGASARSTTCTSFSGCTFLSGTCRTVSLVYA